MSATEKKLDPTIRQIGVIAGGGSLPGILLHACDKKGIAPFVVGFEGHTDPSLVEGRNHMWTRLGVAGQVINTLKAHEIFDLVLIGSINRPSLSELRPDLKTAEIFAKLALKAVGDNDLLGAVRGMLEEEGFRIHGVQEFAENLLTPGGAVGKYSPKKPDWIDIDKGFEVSQLLGAQDIGQSVIVQEGVVLGVEAVEGTDELIRRCKHLKKGGRGGVLVKSCKPQQDRNLDLPTIGPETVKNAADCGLAGIAVHAGASLLVDPQTVAEIADRHKMFVMGIDPFES